MQVKDSPSTSFLPVPEPQSSNRSQKTRIMASPPEDQFSIQQSHTSSCAAGSTVLRISLKIVLKTAAPEIN